MAHRILEEVEIYTTKKKEASIVTTDVHSGHDTLAGDHSTEEDEGGADHTCEPPFPLPPRLSALRVFFHNQ